MQVRIPRPTLAVDTKRKTETLAFAQSIPLKITRITGNNMGIWNRNWNIRGFSQMLGALMQAIILVNMTMLQPKPKSWMIEPIVVQPHRVSFQS
jgi:hypothetical protein